MNGTDFHSHLIPGVDDGAQDPDEARAALEALYGEGVRRIVTTPHLDGSLTTKPGALAERLEALDEGWRKLEAVADAAGLEGLTLGRGVELKLDTPEVDVSDPRLRLAGGPYVLVEFPFMSVPPQSARVLRAIRDRGYVPVVAHPERYADVDERMDVAREWREAGAYLQVNVGSIIGRYGADAMKNAMTLLSRGWVDSFSSDYHARGRPRIRDARERLAALDGEEQAELLLVTNPSRIVRGELPLPVPPLLPRQRFWRKLTRVFR